EKVRRVIDDERRITERETGIALRVERVALRAGDVAIAYPREPVVALDSEREVIRGRSGGGGFRAARGRAGYRPAPTSRTAGRRCADIGRGRVAIATNEEPVVVVGRVGGSGLEIERGTGIGRRRGGRLYIFVRIDRP